MSFGFNTNNNAQAAQPQQQVAQPQQQATGFFPQSQARSNGGEFINQNTSTGEFVGRLKALRPIQSKANGTVFAVIDIEVPGKQGVFQDFLNFNPLKETQSVAYLVNHTKSLLASAGEPDQSDDEKDLSWVEQAINYLVSKDSEVQFRQAANSRNQVSINYL